MGVCVAVGWGVALVICGKQSSQVEIGGQNGDDRPCLGTKRRAALCARRVELLS